MGNPPTFVYAGGSSSAALGSALGNAAFLSDPGCNNAGGLNTGFGQGGTNVTGDGALTGFCRYQYTYFDNVQEEQDNSQLWICLLYTSPSPRDLSTSRMPSSA